MPVERVEWIFSRNVSRSGGFDASGRFTVENVTQSDTLADFDISSYLAISEFLTLDVNVGDVIRITAQLEASGFVPPGVNLGAPGYNVYIFSGFTVPEPSVTALFVAGLLGIGYRRRRSSPMK
ncbi:MAG: PEP-CTERM sorting domain-containing protein [Phycisphaerales bacterium]|nr:PEP-CTERM sorting domain-containing protein [Phycisphaerales bacterium]